MKKYILPLYLIASLMMFVACDHIADDERLIHVPMQPAKRVVLLEDFTGQQCVNCPKGSEVIEQLQEAYPDNVIAVGIHGGPLGFKGNSVNIGLATDLGDTYYNHWELEYQPVGLINRHGAVNYTDWTKGVKEELEKESPLEMELTATLQEHQVHVTVKETALRAGISGNVQVWLLEDDITALQKMPDGSVNKTYVHNHVLRAAINGTWGEECAPSEGETLTQDYKQTIDDTWNTSNLSVVAFVYNDSGVLQAIKTTIEKQ